MMAVSERDQEGLPTGPDTFSSSGHRSGASRISATINTADMRTKHSRASDSNMWALSYQQLMDVEDLAQETFGTWSYCKKTMRDVNKHIIVPHCRKFATSYARSLNPLGLKTDAFITHCWDEPFADFVDSIKSAFLPFTNKPNLWICAFALQQGDPSVVQEQIEVPLQESPFVLALRAASWFVVVRNSKTDLYSRIWCVCELMFAREFGFTTAHKTMVIGPDKFQHLRTSCLHAEAFDPGDKKRILQAIQKGPGSLEAIDKLVLQYRKHQHHREKARNSNREFYIIATMGLMCALAVSALAYAQISRETASQSLLESHVRHSTHASGNSPQRKALEWIIQHPQYTQMPEWRNQQLYTLHNLYYSAPTTPGEELKTNSLERRLSLSHECELEWSTLGNQIESTVSNYPRHDWDVSCTRDMRVQNISLLLRDDTYTWRRPSQFGSISPEISLLGTSLQSFRFSSKFLVGSLPTELGMLTNLQNMQIDSSILTGFLPTEVGCMTSLTSLTLTSDGKMTAHLPTELGLVTALVSLKLHDNRLFGPIPSELAQLTGLKTLELHNNMLTGTVPVGLCDIGSLRTITVDCDRVSCECSCPGQCQCARGT